MVAEVKEDPEAGFVGADGDGEWMEELLQSHGAGTALGTDLELPCRLELPMPTDPWSNQLSSSIDEAGLDAGLAAGLADPFANLGEDSWGLHCEGADLDGMLQALSSSPREGFKISGDETCTVADTFRIDVQESQESNRVQESASSSQANSNTPEEKVRAESSGGSPASSSGTTPFSGAAKGVKKEKESDSDSDNCAGNRPLVEQGDVEKLQERLMRNRESAQLSRQRKKAYMEEMAARIRSLSTTVSELTGTIAHLSAENASLRHQLAFYLPPGTAPPLPAMAPPYMPQPIPGMRPLYPAPGSVAYGGYPAVMRPGYVPPVPIPRLPVQSATSTKKVTTKRGTKSKAKDATDAPKQPATKRMKLPGKAAAGISAMALFCFAMVIAPASWHASELSAGTAVQPAGFEGFGTPGVRAGARVLMSLPEGNASTDGGGVKTVHGKGGLETSHEWGANTTGREGGGEAIGTGLVNSSLVWQQLVNASSPFATGRDESESQPWVVGKDGSKTAGTARLEVPGVITGAVGDRGDWIKGAVVVEAQRAAARIVSDVALRKGQALMTSQEHERLKGIATLALAGRAETSRHAALPAAGAGLAEDSSGFERYPERQTSNMWSFGGAPFLSSGMCTELFQFSDPVVVDGSSAQQARAAAEEAALAVAREQLFEGAEGKQGSAQKQNQTAGLRGMGRKWKPQNPDAVPMPPVNATGSHFNVKAAYADEKEPERCEDNVFGCKNESSSVVVSVMLPQVGWERATFEPKKGGASKGLGQVFVVVLINSAKYVTYSCSVPSVA